MCGFYKINNEILKFDIDKDIDEIRFNHWIMKRENYERCSNSLEKGLFKMTVRQVERDLGISFYKARTIIKKFEDLGIIKLRNKAKSKVEASIYSYESIYQNSEKNRTVNRTVDNTVDSSNSNGRDEVNQSVNRTVNRTLKKENKKENKKDIYSRVVTKLNSTVNSNFKASTKKTKSLIDARLNEGFTVEDFETVIDKKSKEWLNTEMEIYLRPQTLFGTKFEGYLNQKEKTPRIGANKSNYNSSICKASYKNTEKIEVVNNFA